MIKPMLASPMSKADITNWVEWAIEEKFDGHRLIVEVAFADNSKRHVVTARTRPRKHAGDVSGKSMATRALPPHLIEELAKLPCGIYDGELLADLADGTSTDVTRGDLADTLRFVVFDLLQLCELRTLPPSDLTPLSYDDRRRVLETIFNVRIGDYVTLATSRGVTGADDVADFVKAVWERGGEGAILKRRAARYQAGKRSLDFIKVKRMQSAVLTIVGFEPTRGAVLNRGPFASVVLKDEDGNETSCKTLNDFELNRFNRQWEQVTPALGYTRWAKEALAAANTKHPAIGRKLRIDFPMRTRTGGYQGPVMWDRFEDE